ncbi:MAG TPA: Mpo1-like protein [Ideonella sp.]|nr:Mpo1-like protein [Ideonella sp.]
MKTLEQHLSQYAAYHRDTRNIATHFVGIPLIVVAIVALLSRPAVELAGWPLSPAVPVAVAAAAYYLRLDRPLGALMAALLALALWAGAWAAAQPTAAWLSYGIGAFVVGWAFQFLGHVWEGRKPAFVDDVMGLIIGPLFVAAEAVFLLGLRPALKRQIDASAGPVRHATEARRVDTPRP